MVLISKREIETRTDLQKELRANKKRKAKANQMPKTSPRERRLHTLDHKSNVHLEIRAHSSINETRRAEARDDLFLLSPKGFTTPKFEK